MKNQQIARIEEFVDSLENHQLQDGQQALVLQSEFNLIGGRNSSCENNGAHACRDKNGTCTNKSNCGSQNTSCGNGGAGLPGAL